MVIDDVIFIFIQVVWLIQIIVIIMIYDIHQFLLIVLLKLNCCPCLIFTCLLKEYLIWPILLHNLTSNNLSTSISCLVSNSISFMKVKKPMWLLLLPQPSNYLKLILYSLPCNLPLINRNPFCK
jgi:hypothetical protein